MSTSIFGPSDYNPKQARRKKWIITGVVVFVLLSVYLWFQFRNWPEERVVNRFFQALEARDYEKAYGIWMADPNWKQHPNQHARYHYGEFYLDWGPGGEYGLIKSHHIDGTANPKGGGSGVVVVVTVNERVEPKSRLWVEKSDKTMSYSPF